MEQSKADCAGEETGKVTRKETFLLTSNSKYGSMIRPMFQLGEALISNPWNCKKKKKSGGIKKSGREVRKAKTQRPHSKERVGGKERQGWLALLSCHFRCFWTNIRASTSPRKRPFLMAFFWAQRTEVTTVEAESRMNMTAWGWGRQ